MAALLESYLQNSTTVRFIPAATLTVSPLPISPRRPVPRTAARALHKGQQTRAAILEAALGLSAHMGLEGLSIGALAEVTQMSKSGVFAHFGSREELQIAVIREYHARFEEEVFFPAVSLARGLPRLRALFERWVRRVSVEVDSGCIYISGAVEFDDRPGPVRDALASMVRAWLTAGKNTSSSKRAWYSRITAICNSSREPKWANTPDLLICVTSASAPIDKPSRPMWDDRPSAASRIAARVCWPLCRARAALRGAARRGDAGKGETVKVANGMKRTVVLFCRKEARCAAAEG